MPGYTGSEGLSRCIRVLCSREGGCALIQNPVPQRSVDCVRLYCGKSLGGEHSEYPAGEKCSPENTKVFSGEESGTVEGRSRFARGA